MSPQLPSWLLKFPLIRTPPILQGITASGKVNALFLEHHPPLVDDSKASINHLTNTSQVVSELPVLTNAETECAKG